LNSNAPSVDFPVGRFFLGAYLVVGLSVATACVFVLSYFAGDFAGWRASLMLLVWALASFCSIRAVMAGQPQCWLSWDGNAWQVLPVAPHEMTQPCIAESAMSVHLDLQRYMLVSVFNASGLRQWFWVTHASFPDRWHGFRCAVYSSSS
jgi:hypothetical protein